MSQNDHIVAIYPFFADKSDVPPFELMQLSALHTSLVVIDQNSTGVSDSDVAKSALAEDPQLIILLGRSIKNHTRIWNLSALLRESTDVPIMTIGEVNKARGTFLRSGLVDSAPTGDLEAILPCAIGDLQDRGGLCQDYQMWVPHLDLLPLPNYGSIDLSHYLSSFDSERYSSLHPYAESEYDNVIEVFASRGCNQGCTFCTLRSSTSRKVSVDYFMRHIDFLRATYEVNFFEIGDACFTSDLEWIIDFAREAARRHIGFRVFGARADQVSHEVLGMMRDAGCISIHFGFESGSQSVLTRMGKGLRVEQSISALVCARTAGLESPVQLVIGHPGETYATLKETANALKKNDVPVVESKVRCALPIPSTPMYTMFTEMGYIPDELEYLQRIAEIDTTNQWHPKLVMMRDMFLEMYYE